MKNNIKVFEDNAGSLHIVIKGENWSAIIANLSADDAVEMLDDEEIYTCDEDYIDEPFMSTSNGDDVDSTIDDLEEHNALIWDNGKYDISKACVEGEKFLLMWISFDVEESAEFVKTAPAKEQKELLFSYALENAQNWDADDATSDAATLLSAAMDGDINSHVGIVEEIGNLIGWFESVDVQTDGTVEFCDVSTNRKRRAAFEKWAESHFSFVEQDEDSYWYQKKVI